jgi:uncharacterized protein (DUF1778 family)
MAVAMREERLEARVTAEQKELFKEAAQLRGQTLTDFIVSSVRETALAVLRERQVVELSRRDQQAFVAALLGPAKPNRRLREAAKRQGYLANR